MKNRIVLCAMLMSLSIVTLSMTFSAKEPKRNFRWGKRKPQSAMSRMSKSSGMSESDAKEMERMVNSHLRQRKKRGLLAGWTAKLPKLRNRLWG